MYQLEGEYAKLNVFTKPLHHRQDVTQDQFLNGVIAGLNSRFPFSPDWFPYQSSKEPRLPYYLYMGVRNKWIHAFPKSISTK